MKLLILGSFLFWGVMVNAQIGIGTTNPDSSSILDITSTEKGVLVPRLSSFQRTHIVSPATGLLVYDSTTKGFWFYNGNDWVDLSAPREKVWLLGGNRNTDPDIHFIGTINRTPLKFRVNNVEAGLLDLKGNVFWGMGAGSVNTGIDNVGIGKETLFHNTTGKRNTASGSGTLFSNTIGNQNTANGFQALYSNTTGSRNVANGYRALFNNISGSRNTSIGYRSLIDNTTGLGNTASGHNTLTANTQGNFNTAIGYNSLRLNTTGSSNVGLGSHALYGNISGDYNIGIGSDAIRTNSIGHHNTAIGHEALNHSIAGSHNVGIGRRSLYKNIVGNNNTAIGNYSNVSTGNLTNATAIGYKAVVNASNKVRVGNTNITRIEGQVPWSYPSDARFKYHINQNVPGLDFIMKLNPVTYYFDQGKLERFTSTGILTDSPAEVPLKVLKSGFLAQEVEKAANEIGYDFDGIYKPSNDRDNYSLGYSQFVVPLVQAVQDQQQIIAKLQTRLRLQEDRINKLEAKPNKIPETKIDSTFKNIATLSPLSN